MFILEEIKIEMAVEKEQVLLLRNGIFKSKSWTIGSENFTEGGYRKLQAELDMHMSYLGN